MVRTRSGLDAGTRCSRSAVALGLGLGIVAAPLWTGSRLGLPTPSASPTPSPAEVPRDFVQRTLRGRQPDTLQRRRARASEALDPLERQGEVRPALGRDQRVNLVEDDRVQRAQRFPRIRGQQEIQGFGRRDQDVRGLALEPGALRRRRVPCADRNRRQDVAIAPCCRAIGDAGERRPQITLDVDGEGFEG